MVAYQDESFPPGEPDHVDAIIQQQGLVAGQGRHHRQHNEGGVGQPTGGQGARGYRLGGTDQFSGEVCASHNPSHSGEDNSKDREEIHLGLAVGAIPAVASK